MRLVIVGLGVQGQKRLRIAGDAVVACVDPVAAGATHAALDAVDPASYDAAILCTPDQPKFALIERLLDAGKHVMVEKPLFAPDGPGFEPLRRLAAARGRVCYTAYNHRFEPHFVRVRDLIRSGELGRIYHLRLFYGNGTARLVRDSRWRDRGSGVLADLGSHLLDTLRFWFGEDADWQFQPVQASRFENQAFDHVVLRGAGTPTVELEMTLLSWRNHFTLDLFAENGSAHVQSLCKWGPSTFTHRRRVLPSGRPTETTVTLVEDDPTWAVEHDHFLALCRGEARHDAFATDAWIWRSLSAAAQAAGAEL